MSSEGRIKLKKIQNMLLTFNRIELLLVGCALVVIQGCGITAAPSGWGLDASWVWMTDNASRTLQFSHGSYIWTYGPLSFLDFQQATWKLGFVFTKMTNGLEPAPFSISAAQAGREIKKI